MDDSSTFDSGNAPAEFYLPATFQFGRVPGRIERFLRRTFGNRDRIDRPAVDSPGHEFYLPATPDVKPVEGR